MKHRIFRASLICSLCLFCLIPLMLVGCRQKAPAEQNAVTAVIPDGKGKITVKAELTQSFLDGYLEKKVYLFEIPSVYTADVNLEELDPVAETKVKGDMIIRIDAYDGVRSRLHSSFLLASYDRMEDTYTALTTPLAVTSFAEMSGFPTETNEEVSIKGLISDHPADAIRLGIAHTVVDVPMEDLILKEWQEDAVSYIYNGVTAYLNAEALSTLDDTVKAYTNAGVRVYLRFLLGGLNETNHTPLSLYFQPDEAVDETAFYAVNMTHVQTAEIMEGFFDFMADRYASSSDGSGAVTSFIIGYRVNHASAYNKGGEHTLASYVANYEKLVRVAYTAVRSHSADGQVYISLDSRRSAGDETGGWDIPAFLSAFSDACALRGNYDWNLACELYADTTDIWNEKTDTDNRYYTVHSLRTLTDLLLSDQYRTPDGEERSILISGLSIPAVTKDGEPSVENNARQAASYAYAYMTCVQNGHVEALIYSAYTDTAENADHEPQCGLWTLTERGDHLAVSEKRPLYDLFRKIDTTDAASLSGELTGIIDEPFTKLERALAGKEQPVKVIHGTAELESFESNHLKASSLFPFDRGTLHGFANGGNLTYMELVHTEVLNTVTCNIRFDRTAVCDPMGITVTIPAAELMGGERMILDLYGGMADSAAVNANPTVALRLTSPSTGSIVEGEGAVIYEASVSNVSGGVWQTAVFDVEEFTSLLDISDTVILTIQMDYDSEETIVGTGQMGLAGIYVTGHIATGQMSIGAIIAIVTVAAIAVIGVFLFLFLRHRKRR